MAEDKQEQSEFLVEHFFRNEYGKIVAVISKYVTIETAEDIVQETLLAAVEYWQHKGIPANPHAWLYTTAKNKALNILRSQSYERAYQANIQRKELDTIEFSEEQISDEQLRVMTECCHPSISEETQITLILKILCGFSIAEIASAFCTKNETINKRLVRGRAKLKKNGFNRENPIDIQDHQEVLLKTIYLLFNEGYFPAKKDQALRKDFCLEAIRLATILVSNKTIKNQEHTHALLALMCLNCSRFEARTGKSGEIIEMELQDRTYWNQALINKGLFHLGEAQKNQAISKYLILAGISANHSISQKYERTNWTAILSLYDALLQLENSAIVRLNRLVALSKVQGPHLAITELLNIQNELSTNHLFYSSLASLYTETKEYLRAKESYKKAISLAVNQRDKQFLTKKLQLLVPIS